MTGILDISWDKIMICSRYHPTLILLILLARQLEDVFLLSTTSHPMIRAGR